MNEYHDDQTMTKVHAALRGEGLTDREATEAIAAMQNVGILFRERSPEPHVSESPVVDRMIHCVDARGTAVDFRSYPEPDVSGDAS